MDEESIFCRDTEGQCVCVALANGIHALSGRKDACEMLREGVVVTSSLSRAQTWLEKHAPRYRLEIVEALVAGDLCVWMLDVAHSEAVYLVMLIGLDSDGGKVDHCLVLDTFRETVLDPCETKPLRARGHVLEYCVGDGFELQEVLEVRKMVKQPQRKGKKRKRRNPYE